MKPLQFIIVRLAWPHYFCGFNSQKYPAWGTHADCLVSEDELFDTLRKIGSEPGLGASLEYNAEYRQEEAK